MTATPVAVLPRRVAIVATFPVRTAEELAQRLDPPLFRTCQPPEAWTAGSSSDRRYNDFDADLAEELRRAGPHFVAELGPDGLLPELPEELREVSATFAGQSVRLTVVDAAIGVTGVGYGTVRLVYDVSCAAGRGTAGPELVDLALASALEEAIDRTVASFVCDLEVVSDGSGAREQETVSAQECLWAHVLYLFADREAPAVAGVAPVADAAHADVHLTGGTIRPGLGSSLVTGGDHAVYALALRTLALSSAYYAALADVDRRVFSCLVDWRAAGQAGRRTAMAPSEGLFEEVSLFQAVLETLNLHLAASTADEVRVWSAINVAWRMDEQLRALTVKLTLVQTLQERAAERLALARSDRLTVVAFAFTVLSFLGVLLDLVQFGQDDPLAVPEPVRTSLSLLFVLAVGTAFLLGVRQRRR